MRAAYRRALAVRRAGIFAGGSCEASRVQVSVHGASEPHPARITTGLRARFGPTKSSPIAEPSLGTLGGMAALSDLREYFLSHAGVDKEFVKSVATRMQLAGRGVFLDEWSIEFGESIPGAISTALRDFEAIVLFWSQAARDSAWVTREFNSAITRFVEDGRVLLVVRLDETDVPELVRDLKWIDGRAQDPDLVANAVLGLYGRERLIAMQSALDELGIRMEYFEGYGVLLACPRCGASVDNLRGWSQTDDLRDDTYAGAKCLECGWNDGSEI